MPRGDPLIELWIMQKKVQYKFKLCVSSVSLENFESIANYDYRFSFNEEAQIKTICRFNRQVNK